MLADLTDAPEEAIRRERGRVAREGWGDRLLALQRPDGQWGDGRAYPFWWTNLYTLVWLRDLGVDPEDERVAAVIDRVDARVTWGPGFGDSPFFEGEVEPCINGRVVALGAYFGRGSERLVDRLLNEQLEDGGWNCEAERGSTRSSFHTTICVLEGLLAWEEARGPDGALTGARKQGEEYLLERRLLRRSSTGEVIDPVWTRVAFPPLWHYDVLRALDHLRRADGVGRADEVDRADPVAMAGDRALESVDDRLNESLDILAGARRPDGTWALDVRHPKTLHEEIAGVVGAPNRWVTLRAMRTLRWAGRDPGAGRPAGPREAAPHRDGPPADAGS